MEKLIRVTNLKKYFPLKEGIFKRTKKMVYAVDDISFDIEKGETLGLVGESGCGKSTVGMTIMRLIEPTAGEVIFDAKNISQLDDESLRGIRKKMGVIFQDPYSSLDPRMQIVDIVAEPLKTHTPLKNNALREKVLELLVQVGLGREHLNRYPHEFSGGQRQRISIARALALNPSFLTLDEPTSALDVSVQAQVLNLLSDLQQKLNLTYLFISHNLAVVEHISHRIIIMYLGKIVEMGNTRSIFSKPLHPYSEALLSAIPNPDIDQQRRGERVERGAARGPPAQKPEQREHRDHEQGEGRNVLRVEECVSEDAWVQGQKEASEPGQPRALEALPAQAVERDQPGVEDQKRDQMAKEVDRARLTRQAEQPFQSHQHHLERGTVVPVFMGQQRGIAPEDVVERVDPDDALGGLVPALVPLHQPREAVPGGTHAVQQASFPGPGWSR